VEVRSKAEILATLDKHGRLEGLPFMPEMFAFCGRRFRVYKRAHKTCDTVNQTGGRRMNAAVHLEGLRCNGEAHGGCQASCLLFWKEVWLKPVAEQAKAAPTASSAAGCSEADVTAGTMKPAESKIDSPAYVCQATEIPAATSLIPWWDARQFVEDYSSGNVELWNIVKGLFYAGYNRLINAGIGLGAILRGVYEVFQKVVGGVPYPRRHGKIPAGGNTPSAKLDLQPGDLVRVKPYSEILKTVDEHNRNRGLYFDAEMVPYCGGTYRVLKRVSRIINERTGKMMTFKNDCIILDGVICQSRYSEKRFFCPRAIYSYWREIWLERVEPGEPGITACPSAERHTTYQEPCQQSLT